MKEFMILNYGFEKPTADEMARWNEWFAMVADRQIERGGFASGRELTPSGTTELPFERSSITGYTVIRAESLDEAEEIARACPIVDSTRVYELRK